MEFISEKITNVAIMQITKICCLEQNFEDDEVSNRYDELRHARALIW